MLKSENTPFTHINENAPMFEANDVIYDVNITEFFHLVASALHDQAGINIQVTENTRIPLLSVTLGDINLLNAYPCSTNIKENEAWSEKRNASQIKIAALLPKKGGLEICNLYNSAQKQKFVLTQKAIEMSEIIDFNNGKVCAEILSIIIDFIGTYKKLTRTKSVTIH